MRKFILTTGLVGLICTAWLIPGAAFAEHSSNDCTPTVTGPRKGPHTAKDTSADAVLWPPNHKPQTITLSATNSHGNACDITITDVRADEAVDEPGSGNSSPDSRNCSNAGNTSRVDLLSERSGLGDGRYYHISYTSLDRDASDENNQSKAGEAKVLVPHDQGVKKVWTDGGGLFPTYTGVFSCPE